MSPTEIMSVKCKWQNLFAVHANIYASRAPALSGPNLGIRVGPNLHRHRSLVKSRGYGQRTSIFVITMSEGVYDVITVGRSPIEFSLAYQCAVKEKQKDGSD